MLKTLATALVSAGLFAAPLFASEQTEEEATGAGGAPFNIETATCADIFDLYEDATPGEGKDEEALEEAQDTVLYFVVWVHGYLSGRDGIDRKNRPLSREGIEITVKDIADVCRVDESELFLDVVGKIGQGQPAGG